MASEIRGVKMSASADCLALTADHPDVGEAREEIDHEMTGDPVAIGFNPKYMTELLSALDSDRVVIELNGELDPLVVRTMSGEGLLGVIMPMRV
jgi:DNA polymerase-3 subunit beta